MPPTVPDELLCATKFTNAPAPPLDWIVTLALPPALHSPTSLIVPESKRVRVGSPELAVMSALGNELAAARLDEQVTPPPPVMLWTA